MTRHFEVYTGRAEYFGIKYRSPISLMLIDHQVPQHFYSLFIHSTHIFRGKCFYNVYDNLMSDFLETIKKKLNLCNNISLGVQHVCFW